jgi:hypothetical protein
LGLCIFYSAGWVVWLVLTVKLIGFGHPEVIEPEAPLSPARKWICATCALVFVLCVMPIPISQVQF